MTETNSATEGEIHFSVPGMKCGGCAGAVDRVLRRQPGVRDLTIDVPGKKASLVVDPKVFDQGKTLQALTEAGYPSLAVA